MDVQLKQCTSPIKALAQREQHTLQAMMAEEEEKKKNKMKWEESKMKKVEVLLIDYIN